MKTQSPLTLALLAALAPWAVPSTVALTPTESAQILYMKQEEKLARDVYQVLSTKWGTPCFANLVRSETRHMAAIDTLITAYGLQDSTPSELGKFTIPELQSLYEQLVHDGTESLAQSVEVGLAIEKTDIADLQEILAQPHDAAIQRVFSQLLDGSERHLSALEKGCDGTQTCTGQRRCGAGAGQVAAGTCTKANANSGGACAGKGNGGGNGKGNAAGTGECLQTSPAPASAPKATATKNQGRR